MLVDCLLLLGLNDQMRHQMKTDSSGFYQKLHESLIGKIISAKQRQMESSREDLQEHLLRLQKEVEHLRGQVQLCSSVSRCCSETE